MNREIKFRAWDIESKIMLQWDEIEDTWCYDGYHCAILSNDHYICMQFLGIYDKNGNEIYEDDIVNVEDSYLGRKRQIIWVEDRHAWGYRLLESLKNAIGKDLLGAEDLINYRSVNNIEIVGNIHDEPTKK